MSQPIQSMLDGAQMHNAMVARAQGPMMRELSPAGPQAMYDPGSSVVANVQPQREMQYAQQQVTQNVFTQGVGQAAQGQAMVRNNALNDSGAKDFLQRRASEVMVGLGKGENTLAVQQKMQGPERASFLNELALGKAQAIGTNPALAQEAAQIMQLRGMA